MTAASIDRLEPAAETRGPAWSVLGAVLAVVLVLDGLLSLALEVLYLPTYIGATPFPIAAAVAAVGNVALIAGMGAVVDRPAAMSLPLIAWLFGFLICSTAGPGGDVLLTDDWASPLLLACGLIPAGFYLFRKAFPPVRV
ncbi:hypothetical protein NDR87_17395 [Nocardia sp. CDC159]|uniref:Facilitated glucose transporter n=1 Tax=Nocardia pulmonis TaxID=2951408 RepID=A0A9X2ECT9_9NOCA|nr:MULTISPECIES: hypothetical protein [Nocardia]MCM6775888.1 hypothetical protein [Nocardia pulmonis]MCM6788136.1 hypothetical protein [Nocardia sp. CDC159]